MREPYSEENITRKNNILTLHKCNQAKCASDFLIALKKVIDLGYVDVVIKSDAPFYYTNGCVLIAGIINYYQSHGISFRNELDPSDYLNKCGAFSPYGKSREELQAEKHPFDKIFLYEDSGQVADITQAYIDAISHMSVCEEGVLNGLTWCINEVMDNVLLHSLSGFGLVMAQYHPKSKYVAICIYDHGIGIFKTMEESAHKPKTEIDAISMAIQEGVGDGKGQGNGLYGLYKTVRDNGGRLSITSGNSSLMLTKEGEIIKFEHIPFISYESKGTVVDFQLDLNKSIDIKKVFSSIGGFDGFDIRIDNMLDDTNNLIYDVFENGQGTATREAGEYLRTDIENILRRQRSVIVLDFKNVKAVSSSFIDELVAKLVLDLGFIAFNSAIRLANMTDDIAYLCERSLYMRIHDSWKTSKE